MGRKPSGPGLFRPPFASREDRERRPGGGRTDPGPASPPSVGAIIPIRPQVQVVVGLSGPSFGFLWALAAANQLRYGYLAFTAPHRGSSLVVSAELGAPLGHSQQH
jgi:hypothetical protein